MADKNIKIPAKHYVGMVKRNTEKLPLGFMTPWGEDEAAKKRMATVDSWASRGYNSSKLPAMVIDNVPLGGFKMTTDIRSSSYGGSDKWRIEDPRGFELEITSHNLAQLLSVGMIDRGEIADTCVWARDGQQNVLLSTSTEEYKAAVQNTAVAAMSASWRDVKVGNTILLQNNVTGVWLGRMRGIEFDRYNGRKNDSYLVVGDKLMHVIHVKEKDKLHDHKLILVSSPKLASIVNKDTITESEAETLANQLLIDPKCSVEQAGYKHYIALSIGTVKAGDNLKLSLKPLSVPTSDMLVSLTDYKSKQFIFTKSSQYLNRIVSSMHYGAAPFTALCYDKTAFENNQIVPVGEMVQERAGMWGRTNTVWKQTTHQYNFNEYDSFYYVEIEIETKAGTKIVTNLR